MQNIVNLSPNMISASDKSNERLSEINLSENLN